MLLSEADIIITFAKFLKMSDVFTIVKMDSTIYYNLFFVHTLEFAYT